MSARAGRWDLLEYNSDPVPGCPERVRAGAQRYVETAEEIRIAATNLRSISYDQKSKAINKIREQARSIAAELDKAHSRCDGAGGAYGTTLHLYGEKRSRPSTRRPPPTASGDGRFRCRMRPLRRTTRQPMRRFDRSAGPPITTAWKTPRTRRRGWRRPGGGPKPRYPSSVQPERRPPESSATLKNPALSMIASSTGLRR